MGKWWWLDWPPWQWSREEQDAVSQLGLTMGAIFLLLEIPQFVFLKGPFWNSTFVALITTAVTLFISLFATRPICTALWPEKIKAGDEKAAERLAKVESPD